MLTGSQLAAHLSVSKGRVSQWLSEGKLEGCYTGEGRHRRYYLDKACAALGRRLDQGQMLGNGAATRAALNDSRKSAADLPEPAAHAPPPRDGSELPATDAGRYELARAQKIEEEARRLRRENLLQEGTLVLASEVDRQVARVLAQEVAEFEGVMRAAARAIADRMGVDFKTARQILVDTWRTHRASRSQALAAEADTASASDLEAATDF